MSIKEFIKEIEAHTGKPFDANNPRHTMHLQTKVESFYADRLTKLSLIETVIRSTERENSAYNSRTHYVVKRR